MGAYWKELLALGVGALVAVFISYNAKLSASDAMYVSISAGFAVYLVFTIGSITRSLDDIRRDYSHLRVKVGDQGQLLKAKNMATDLVVKLADFRDPAIQQASLMAFQDLVRKFYVDDDQVDFIGDDLALTAYDIFWDALAEAQMRRRHMKQSSLWAVATQATSIRIYQSASGTKLMQAQQRFVENGGKLTRILIHRPVYEEPIEFYQEVMGDMIARGIDTYYLPVLNAAQDVDLELTSDFLVVSEFDYVVAWLSDSEGRKIERCKLIKSDRMYKQHLARWERTVQVFRAIDWESPQMKDINLPPLLKRKVPPTGDFWIK